MVMGGSRGGSISGNIDEFGFGITNPLIGVGAMMVNL